MKARPYQQECIDEAIKIFKTKRSALGVLFTGAGKTVCVAFLAQKMVEMTGKRVLVIAHREELITQAADKITKATNLTCEIEMGANWASTANMLGCSDVIVATVQTLYQEHRMQRFDPNDFCLIVTDEAHRAPAASYNKIYEYFYQNPNIKHFGCTATPDRADELAMGTVFDDVASDYDIAKGIDDGWLVQVQQQVVEVASMNLSECRTKLGDFAASDLNAILDQEKVIHEMVVPSIEITGDKKTLVFASKCEQAKLMTEIYNRYQPGTTEYIDGKTPKDVRRDIIHRYAKGEIRRLCNVGVLIEGFDDSGVEAIVNCQPTKARNRYAQIFGRMTRPAEEIAHTLNDCIGAEERKQMIADSIKPSALMVDMVGNSGRHKLITVADILGGKYPDEVVELALKNNQRRGKPEDVMSELKRAELEIAKRHKAAMAAKAREGIKFNGKFYVKSVSPFDVLDIAPARIPGYKRTNPVSPKQKALLEKWGIPNVDQVQNTIHASQLIEAMPPSSAQMYRLRQAGLPLDKINRMKANQIISILAKSNWKPTQGNMEFIYKEIINKKENR
jgi:superfamily II DNA or RNA helicase